MKLPRSPCLAWLCLLFLVFFFFSAPGWSAGILDEIPSAELTGGGRAGDGVSEGFGDIVAPVLLLDSGLVFVNPRASYADDSSEEYNLGVGYRHLLAPKNLILGANVYYDYRETSLDSRFHQVGFGVEMLGTWIDARANYYLPQDDKETVNEYDVETIRQSSSSSGPSWSAPYATGNAIVQDSLTVKTLTTTTTKQHFEQYEEAMEGWDCEFGVRLPIPGVMDYADVKLFGGYYSYNASFGDDDIDGFKGRLEIKALPAVYLDAEIYENKELTGSDYFFGARMSVPFDVANISKGRNPFAGTVAGFKPSAQRVPFASRLTEMVMRDLHVRTEISEVREDVRQREETRVSRSVAESSRYTLVTNANFVDGDNQSGVEDGTAEHPFNTISEGVSNAVGLAMIYVSDAASAYRENVILSDGLIVWGSGCLIQGQAGLTFGSGIYPVVDGRSRGPTFILANHTTLRGLEIVNSEDVTQPSRPFDRPEWGTIETRRVGVFADDVTDISLIGNRVNSVQYGALLGMDGDLAVTLTDNEFNGADLDAVKIDGYGAGGEMAVDVLRNAFVDNGGSGLEIMAGNYDTVDLRLADNIASGNSTNGIWIFADNQGPVAVTVDQLTANENGNDGFKVQAYSAATSSPVTVMITNAVFDDNGFCGAEIFTATTADGSGNQMILTDIEALRNGNDGLYADAQTFGDDAPVSVTLAGIEANGQTSDFGIESFATVNGAGDVDMVFDRIHAVRNGNGGVYADAEVLGSRGNVQVAFSEIVASENAGVGIAAWACAYGTNGAAKLSFHSTETRNNGGCGIYSEVYSENESAYLTGERIVSSSNHLDGVRISTYAGSDVFADFGNGAQGSAGLCSIYGNSAFDMNNTTFDSVRAQSNWWGTATPAPGRFNGSVDYSNPLAADPNP